MASTRDRLLAEGMRLFGEQGYSATSVAQIELAAGLSPGSGSLYKHFRSKEELLSAGLDRLLSGGQELTDLMVSAIPPGPADVHAAFDAVARASLRRMDADRDLTRLLFRGLDGFPELMERFSDSEIVGYHRAGTAMLASLAGDGAAEDWPAIVTFLQGALAHFWLLTDLFGSHPTGVDTDRLVAAATRLVAGFLASTGASTGVLTDRSADGTPATT